MANLLDTYDPRKCHVWLKDWRYNNHIQSNHPEIDNIDYIRVTVEEPDFITRDVDDDLREIYYRQGVHPDYPEEWIKVVSNQGFIVTAYVIDYPKKSETVIWTSPSFLARQSP